MKPKVQIESVLTKEQIRILGEWVKANNLDPKTLEIVWEYKYGVQVCTKSKDNQENWSIDFVDKNEEKE
jgi:hypothetical protein